MTQTDRSSADILQAAPGSSADRSPIPRPGPGDQILLARLREGDEAAFTSLVDGLHPRMIRLALVVLHDRAAAEEVVQETWLAVLGGLRRFEGRSTLKTWIFSILMNRARTRAFQARRTAALTIPLESGDEAGQGLETGRFGAGGRWAVPPARWKADSPERLLMQQEALSRLEEAMAELPPGQKAVVTLRDVEGLGSHEVCNVLGITETNQRVLLHRARIKLRAVLEKHLEIR